ncbi:MAG: hypothetical protein JNN24_11705 [Hyphomicrobium zavarzinii]|uniref:hypothetical protein n=1 Tax=Hyphomicrobium zavarzinii TaxID=48292 RepID=UPI001A5032FC|nr:hypothetical protein [Hyphomicrobium zavarzinii]MBL8846424.1 hypothetical protein [Hyphomicrobium zavarzinii]
MKATILAVVALAFSVSNVHAVSLAVKLACRDDYFAHCSMHAVGSPGLRQCMRDVGPRLSSRCIGALADAGEIKKTKVASLQKKKTYAQKPATKKHYAAKADTKKQYAYKAAAKRKAYAKKDDVAKSYDKQNVVKKRYAKKQYIRKQYAKRDLTRT